MQGIIVLYSEPAFNNQAEKLDGTPTVPRVDSNTKGDSRQKKKKVELHE